MYNTLHQHLYINCIVVIMLAGITDNKNGHPPSQGTKPRYQGKVSKSRYQAKVPSQGIHQGMRMTPSLFETKCDIRTMYCVVNNLAPYWQTVGDYLEYGMHKRNSFKRETDKKSIIAVLEDWISTNNGRGPKTWATFTKVLRELDDDLSISVGSETCTKLEKELASSSSKLM